MPCARRESSVGPVPVNLAASAGQSAQQILTSCLLGAKQSGLQHPRCNASTHCTTKGHSQPTPGHICWQPTSIAVPALSRHREVARCFTAVLASQRGQQVPTWTQLLLQPPAWEVRVMYSCSLGCSWGRSRNMCRVWRTTGVVPVRAHLGRISSVGFSRLPQLSHWSPRASCAGAVEAVRHRAGRAQGCLAVPCAKHPCHCHVQAGN